MEERLLDLHVFVNSTDESGNGFLVILDITKPNGVDPVSIGAKETDLRTAHGKKIRDPSINSLNDEVRFSVFNSKSSALIDLSRPLGFPGGRYSVQFGENLFLYPGKQFSPRWLYDPFMNVGTPIDPHVNLLRLVWEELEFNGEIIRSHEALVFGNVTPSVETALTSLDDDYKDKVYVETLNAYESGGFTKHGIKYIYAFDDLIDLTSFLKISFSFSNLDICFCISVLVILTSKSSSEIVSFIPNNSE